MIYGKEEQPLLYHITQSTQISEPVVQHILHKQKKQPIDGMQSIHKREREEALVQFQFIEKYSAPVMNNQVVQSITLRLQIISHQ